MSRRLLAVAGILAAALAVAAAVRLCARPEPPFLLGGIQVNEADHRHWFDALERAGMNTVAATAYARQGDWDSSDLWWDDEEPAVEKEIRGAATRGLHVVLVARVALDHAFPRNRFLWHGLIMPRTDEQLAEWFERYRAFVLEWARIAEREGVDVFAVGSEMNALASTVPLEAAPPLERYYLDADKQAERRERILELSDRPDPAALRPRGGRPYASLGAYLDAESEALAGWARQTAGEDPEATLARLNRRRAALERHWRELIRAVREVYHGSLTYAANFDQYDQVGFWDALDLVGINAYFPLRRPGDPAGDTEALRVALERGWRGILDGLDTFRRERGFPETRVLFTEIGYARRAGVTLAPWAGTGQTLLESPGGETRLVVWEDQPEDLSERALALRALHDVALDRGDGLVRGLLYWKLTTEPAHLDIEPFAHVLGDARDPLGRELRRFGRCPALRRLVRSLTRPDDPGPTPPAAVLTGP